MELPWFLCSKLDFRLLHKKCLKTIIESTSLLDTWEYCIKKMVFRRSNLFLAWVHKYLHICTKVSFISPSHLLAKHCMFLGKFFAFSKLFLAEYFLILIFIWYLPNCFKLPEAGQSQQNAIAFEKKRQKTIITSLTSVHCVHMKDIHRKSSLHFFFFTFSYIHSTLLIFCQICKLFLENLFCTISLMSLKWIKISWENNFDQAQSWT